jgi:gamma-tubulin complex component 5
MAPTTPNTGIADQLVASLLPKGTTASKLRKQKDVFSRKIRIHNYARTNQFEVIKKLDGLQEKFQIFNNDELADAVHIRLVELKQHAQKWLPDILDLLLRLSDDPTNKTKIECLANIGTLPAVVSSLTWAEIEADEPLDRRDQIWRVAEYSDLSSDDDVITVTRAASYSHAKTPNIDEQEAGLQAKLTPVAVESNRKALERLQGDQFWHNLPTDSLELSELQIIREVLFLLQGLPTALFWRVGNRFEIDKRLRLMDISRDGFIDVVSEFGQVSLRLELLRNFTNTPQSNRVMQILRSRLEDTLRQIDGKMCILEQNILAKERGAAATILQLLASVSEIVEVTTSLADLVATVDSKKMTVVQCLELLFKRVCQAQASGDEPDFQYLSHLFIHCLESYLRPLRDWMDQGILHHDHEMIFITASKHSQDPSELWQKWYVLADDTAANCCPSFLRSVKEQMFAIGKTVVFLQNLNATSTGVDGPSILISQEPTLTDATSLVPFSESLATAVQAFVQSRLQIATSTLRDHLGTSCGLWKTLDALNHIYFGRNGYLTDLIDSKIFTAIDKCNKNWNDRYLIGDLLQTVFKPVDSVEVDRLAVKASARISRNLAQRRQSVRLLQDLQIQYKLHWSIANVITASSLTSYSRVSTFLTQIRRARYMLERRSLTQVRQGTPNAPPQHHQLNLLLHHHLLLFTNTLYSHLTTLTIQQSLSTLHRALTHAPDIAAMLTAHTHYCTKLEESCLTAKKLQPIHDEIIAILDLCIRFSDLNNPHAAAAAAKNKGHHRRSSTAAHSYVSATSHQHRRPRRGGGGGGGEGEGGRERIEADDTDETSANESASESEGYSTFTIPAAAADHPSQEAPPLLLLAPLRTLRREFSRHIAFVVAGLAGIVRAGAGAAANSPNTTTASSWEVLGLRLEGLDGKSVVG